MTQKPPRKSISSSSHFFVNADKFIDGTIFIEVTLCDDAVYSVSRVNAAPLMQDISEGYGLERCRRNVTAGKWEEITFETALELMQGGDVPTKASKAAVSYAEYQRLRKECGYDSSYAEMTLAVWTGCGNDAQENMLQQYRGAVLSKDRYVATHGDVW